MFERARTKGHIDTYQAQESVGACHTARQFLLLCGAPLPWAVLCPALSVRRPPVVSFPDPTTMLMLPPAPEVAEPERSTTLPLLPSEASPVVSERLPVMPFWPALAVTTLNAPEDEARP